MITDYGLVLFERTQADSFVSLNGSKETVVLLAILVFMSTVCLSDAHNCTSTGDCDGEDDMQCCNGLCIQSSSCLGHNCKINDDCSTSEVCCNNKCVDNWNCLGQTCSFDDDCQWDESCCYGSCKENNECVDLTAIVIICSLAFVFFVSICSCVCRKVTSFKQRFPLSSEMTSCTTSLNLTGITSSSSREGLSSDFPQKSPSHPTLHTFFAFGSTDPWLFVPRQQRRNVKA
ncbi:hypothetical protein OS493_023422 [Desmophyllum pertusum]|uniref:Uncharacterized protein n=1 Tax=Desmophyllum pertusum TaxID=174260 RepID=A0A9W9ZQE8_9CNID|nr:hypothetical protein OS493_023422 [Desmophyllum pertusum]